MFLFINFIYNSVYDNFFHQSYVIIEFNMMKGDFMSIKNINITLTYANIVGDTVLNTISFFNIEKKHYVNIKSNNRYIHSLQLVIFINAIQNKKETSTKIDPRKKISFSEKYVVRIRLSEEISKQFTDLGEFVIFPEETRTISFDGYEIFKHTRLCIFENIILLDKKSNESFFIKVLIKPLNNNSNDKNTWIVQSVYPIYLTEKN